MLGICAQLYGRENCFLVPKSRFGHNALKSSVKHNAAYIFLASFFP
jgi:hypothetical protein